MTNIFDQNSYFANLLGHPVYDDAFLSWFEMYEERCANNSWKTKMFHSIVTSNKNFCWNVSMIWKNFRLCVWCDRKRPFNESNTSNENFSSKAASALFWEDFFFVRTLAHNKFFFVQFDWLLGKEIWKKKSDNFYHFFLDSFV